MNKSLPLLIIFFSFFINAQTNDVSELRNINKKYDSILIEYQIKAKDSLASLPKKERDKIMAQHEKTVNEERRNLEFALLEKIKLNETEASKNPVIKQNLKCKNDGTPFQMPSFDKKSNYKPTKSKEVKSETEFSGDLNSIVTFTITENGIINNVRAKGNNAEFNRELELTFYKIEKKWTPLCIGGIATTNNFRMPVTMKFN
ncbi:hypothetical protein [Kaistella sp.]|uniref:hypothetical protein n=1 Tax=Kaistella sp. TaxID=2782235 RepID=UPI003C49F18B